MIKVAKKDVGKFVRVQFDDTGSKDGIITEVNDQCDIIKFLHPFEGIVDSNGAPIVKLGQRFEFGDPARIW